MKINDLGPFTFGQVLLVRAPYVEGKIPKVKVRPVVVMSREAINATGSHIVLGISSKPVAQQQKICYTGGEGGGERDG